MQLHIFLLSIALVFAHLFIFLSLSVEGNIPHSRKACKLLIILFKVHSTVTCTLCSIYTIRCMILSIYFLKFIKHLSLIHNGDKHYWGGIVATQMVHFSVWIAFTIKTYFNRYIYINVKKRQNCYINFSLWVVIWIWHGNRLFSSFPRKPKTTASGSPRTSQSSKCRAFLQLLRFCHYNKPMSH